MQLEGFLAARAGGVQRLALKLFHRRSKFTEVPIGLVAPARDAAHFTLLARERLGGLALPEAVRAIAVDAGDVVPLVGEALALFDDGASSPGRLAESSSSGCAPGSAGWPCTVLPSLRSIRPERASRESEVGGGSR